VEGGYKAKNDRIKGGSMKPRYIPQQLVFCRRLQGGQVHPVVFVSEKRGINKKEHEKIEKKVSNLTSFGIFGICGFFGI